MSHPDDQSPINPLPPVVTALFLILAGVEAALWLGSKGIVGGPTAVGWRLDPEIIPAIAFHHDPNANGAGPRDLSRLLCIADIAVYGEIDRRAHRNSFFIQAIANFTRSRVLASKALNQAATAIDRIEADIH